MAYNYNLSNLILPASIRELGKMAFLDDKKLETVKCYAKVPPVLGRNAFSYMYDVGGFLGPSLEPAPLHTKVYVPSQSLESYLSSIGWKDRWDYLYALDDGSDGIEAISELSDVKEYTIFSIDGNFILNTVDINQLDNLQPGLYVVNGKKILIK